MSGARPTAGSLPAASSPYDAGARRHTPLALELKAHIRDRGPITVHRYMHACLYHERYGYYRARQPIGRAGDFTTAPEISQVFGEIVGLWCAVVWQQMGAPARINLVEVGPGRGTLMSDALRALRAVPAFMTAANVHLLETSPAMTAAQRRCLADAPVAVTWHSGTLLGEIATLPTILIANELLDADPVTQLVLRGEHRGERLVGLDDAGELTFLPPAISDDDIQETRELHVVLARELAAMPVAAGLLLDYGHLATRRGATLQAVRDHAYEHPLTSPGEADLSALVDFESLARQCGPLFAVDGPVTQARFLGRLGAAERGSRLMAANPGRAAEIEAGIVRLLAPDGMGGSFKVIGVRSPHLPALPGLD